MARLFPLVMAAVVAAASSAVAPIVKTTDGSVSGVSLVKGVDGFLAIPYAQPPVDDLRFRNPQKAKPWKGVRVATKYSAPCASGRNTAAMRPVGASEDCLYLNVFRPANASAKSTVPVMLYIHGGCYTAGAANSYPKEGIASNLASRGVVVVTIQYRLGIFGFFTTKTSEFPSNLAIKDMILALRWVQTEIAAFGGDKSKVTIFGESAGAGAVSVLTYAKAAKGLFAQAIQESGAATSPTLIDGGFDKFYHQSRQAAVASGLISVTDWQKGNFAGLAGLRKLNTSTVGHLGNVPAIKDGGQGVTCFWMPVVDESGDILPDWPRNLAAQREPNMPVLLGTCHDEMVAIVSQTAHISALNSTSATFDLATEFYILRNFAREYWPQITAEVRDIYAYDQLVVASDKRRWFKAVSQMASDSVFFSAYDQELGLLFKTTTNVYLYSFDYVSKAFPWRIMSTWNGTGVFHSMDLAYLFEIATYYPSYFNNAWTPSKDDETVIDLFGRLWTNFAKTGNPNKGESIPALWRKVSNPAAADYYSINLNPAMGSSNLSSMAFTMGWLQKPYEAGAEELFRVFLPRLTGYVGPNFPTPPPPPPTLQPIALAATLSSLSEQETTFLIVTICFLGGAVLAFVVAVGLIINRLLRSGI